MITLWGRLNSLNVQKVAWCLEEIGIAYRRVDAGMAFGVVGTPEYRAMNPNALVPTLVDGDLTLWESNAIVRYLCARHAPDRFWPSDPGRRGLADRWMDWQQTAFNPAIGRAFYDLVRAPPDKRDPVAIEASRIATEKQLALLDRALAERRWLGGDDFSMAEFAVGPQIWRWYGMPIAREPHPNVERWRDEFMSRPSAGRVMTLPIT